MVSLGKVSLLKTRFIKNKKGVDAGYLGILVIYLGSLLLFSAFFFFNFCQAQLFCFVCWKFFLGQKYSSMGFWFKIFTLENNSTVAFFKNRSYIF